MSIKPMLAATMEEESLVFPYLLSPKLDGIRCLVIEGKAYSRSMKEIPNRHIQQYIAEHFPKGVNLDGELIVGSPIADDVFRVTTSAVMSQDGTPDFTYYVFDVIDAKLNFNDRFEALRYLKLDDRIKVLKGILVNEVDEMRRYEEAFLKTGYEGVMLRGPLSSYKYGRATVKENSLLKVKQFSDAEAKVTGCGELMVNMNEAYTNELGNQTRSSAMEGLVAANTLGYLNCVTDDGIAFKIGSGFTEQERSKLWSIRDKLIGQFVKYKYFSVGIKEAPRFPVYLGLRDKLDMDAPKPTKPKTETKKTANKEDDMINITERKMFGARMTPTRPLKIMINIGACLDIITGHYIKGKYGESILNGGLANLTGIFGMGNSFKSTAMHYMTSAAQARMYGSFIGTYDTEVNIHEWRLAELAMNTQKQLGFEAVNLIETGEWSITDKSVYSGNKWYAEMRDFMKERKESKDQIKVTTPFLDRDGKSLIKMNLAAFSQCDSFSEISTDAIETMQDKAEVGESGQNAVSLKQGQHKNQMLMELPGMTVGSDTYMFLTAHFGEQYSLNPQQPPTKKLSELPQDKKIKGVPEKFTFVTQNCWWAKPPTSLINDGTKEPEYPRDENDDKRRDTDLKKVVLHQTRGKSGPTGIIATLVVSQVLGVLPRLTEFNYIREMGYFGLEGSKVQYTPCFMPDAPKQTRKSIRAALEKDDKLARAVNILSELCQMQEYWHDQPRVYIDPKELYEKVKAAGYDWNFILENTRGYWILEEDERPQGVFLSTMDLINMVVPDEEGKLYHPYWLEADKKTVKKEFINQLKVKAS